MSQPHSRPVERGASEGVLRVLFGSFMAITAMAILLYSAEWFAGLVVLLVLFAAREWHRMVRSPAMREAAEQRPVHVQTIISGVTIALAVLLALGRPILFRQRRAGLHGAPFTLLKFRSMRAGDAPDAARLSRFGCWFRASGLDELPPMINVLRGEMSLVGPRPLPVYEVEKFEDPVHRRRLSMKPGLTCLWQIQGRSKIVDFSDWVRMDLEYIDNWSLFLDAYIILRTIPTVLAGIGAR